jgi:hypothetical protein
MRIARLLPVLCLLGSAACTDAEILAPEPAAAADPQLDLQAAAEDPGEPTLESCIRIVVVPVD